MKSERSVAAISLLGFSGACVLVAVQFGRIPLFRYAWAANLWAYLPLWASVVLAGSAFALCLPLVRSRIFSACVWISKHVARAPRLALDGVGVAVLTGAFWLVRERIFSGDSLIVIGVTRQGWRFIFPDIGAGFINSTLIRSVGLPSSETAWSAQLAVCISGALACVFLARAARYLVPEHRSAAFVLLFVLSGGMLRVFAGHIESYAYLLAPVSAYLWFALVFLAEGRCWLPACLALGVAVWVHLSALLLLPGLVVLLLLREPRPAPGPALRRGALGVAIAAIPSVAFLLGVFLLGYYEDLQRSLELALEVLGSASDPEARRWWVRLWGGGPSIGTDFVYLSPSHLKYLGNAFYLLAPFSLPALLAFAFARRMARFPIGSSTFLLVTVVPLAAYATLLRPFWGPFDWDLFSLTSFFLALLAAHWIAHGLSEPAFRHLAVLLIGFQLVFVAIPFLATGIGIARNAGPFAPGSFDLRLHEPGRAPSEKLAPWL